MSTCVIIEVVSAVYVSVWGTAVSVWFDCLLWKFFGFFLCLKAQRKARDYTGIPNTQCSPWVANEDFLLA